MDLAEPVFPTPDGPKCDVCHCPTEIGRFISTKYRRVCAACWDLYHNKRFDESSYWDNL
jgi:hypothetical protein